MLERLDGVMAVEPDVNRELCHRGCVDSRDHLEVSEPSRVVDAERRCAACGTVGLPHERTHPDVTALVSAWGRLVAGPGLRTTKAGKSWATARVAIVMPQPYGAKEDADPPTLRLGITAIGQTAETLACQVRGECLSIAGRLEMRPSKSRGGEPCRGWTCIANSVIGSRFPRPRSGDKSKLGNGVAAVRPAVAPDLGHAPLDDLSGFLESDR